MQFKEIFWEKNNLSNTVISTVISFEMLISLAIFPIFMYFIGKFNVHPESLPISPNIIFMTTVAVSMAYIHYNFLELNIYFSHIILIFSIFLTYTGFSLLLTPYPSYGFYKFIRLTSITLICMLGIGTIISNSDRRKDRFINIMYIFTLWITFEAIISIITGNTVTSWSVGIHNRIGIGRYSGICTIISVYYFLKSEKLQRKVIYLIVITVSIIVLISAGTRGPFIFSVFSSILYVLTYFCINSSYRSILYSIFVTVFISVPLFIFVSLTDYAYTIERITYIWRDGGGRSVNLRFEYWNYSYQNWIQSPILGNGIGSFPVVVYDQYQYMWPHSIFFEVLVELGIVGVTLIFILMITFTSYLVREIQNSKDQLTLLIFILFIYLLLNSLVSGDLQANRFLFIIMSFVGIVHNNYDKE